MTGTETAPLLVVDFILVFIFRKKDMNQEAASRTKRQGAAHAHFTALPSRFLHEIEP